MNKEIDSLIKNKTWVLVNKSKDKNVDEFSRSRKEIQMHKIRDIKLDLWQKASLKTE